MDVVLPRDADPTADLHALVHNVETVIRDIDLGHAGQPGRLVATGIDLGCQGFRYCFGEFEPLEHVSDAVLQRLEGDNRSAEGKPISGILDRCFECPLGRAHCFGALQGKRELELALE